MSEIMRQVAPSLPSPIWYHDRKRLATSQYQRRCRPFHRVLLIAWKASHLASTSGTDALHRNRRRACEVLAQKATRTSHRLRAGHHPRALIRSTSRQGKSSLWRLTMSQHGDICQ